jgi:hypothetical protein
MMGATRGVLQLQTTISSAGVPPDPFSSNTVVEADPKEENLSLWGVFVVADF